MSDVLPCVTDRIDQATKIPMRHTTMDDQYTILMYWALVQHTSAISLERGGQLKPLGPVGTVSFAVIGAVQL